MWSVADVEISSVNSILIHLIIDILVLIEQWCKKVGPLAKKLNFCWC